MAFAVGGRSSMMLVVRLVRNTVGGVMLLLFAHFPTSFHMLGCLPTLSTQLRTKCSRLLNNTLSDFLTVLRRERAIRCTECDGIGQ